MLPESIVYAIGRAVLRVLYRYEFRVLGAPVPVPALLVSNHYGSLDPILLLLGLRRKLAVFSGKRGHWGHPPAYIPLVGRVPLFPSHRAALRRAHLHVRAGYSLVLFPEGGAQRDVQGREDAVGAFQPGVFFFGARLALPIVPVAIIGAAALWPDGQRFPARYGHVTLHVGTPYEAPSIRETLLARHGVLQERAQELRSCIVRLYESAKDR